MNERDRLAHAPGVGTTEGNVSDLTGSAAEKDLGELTQQPIDSHDPSTNPTVGDKHTQRAVSEDILDGAASEGDLGELNRLLSSEPSAVSYKVSSVDLLSELSREATLSTTTRPDIEVHQLSTCYVIGAGATTMQCCELLRAHRVTIRGVISPATATRGWAEQRQISVYHTVTAFIQTQPEQVDFVFSIANTTILSKSVIQLAAVAAINYHNSLLPEHAGVEANYWTLLAGQEQTGVTFHEMTAEFDTGDLLLQRAFPIEAHDTNASLGLKSHEAAIALFEQLLANGCQRSKQDLAKRSIHLWTDAPPSLGFVDWQKCGRLLLNELRAHSNGPWIESPFGSMKVWIGEEWYAVSDYRFHCEPHCEPVGRYVSTA